MGDVLIFLGLIITIIVAIIAIPIWLWKNLSHKYPKKNYPFRKIAVYTNKIGHLRMIHPDPCMQEESQDYFNNNPKEKKEFLDGLHDEEVW